MRLGSSQESQLSVRCSPRNVQCRAFPKSPATSETTARRPGVEHHDGDAMLTQQGAQLLRADELFLTRIILEAQESLMAFPKLIAADARRHHTIAPVTVEMYDMIVVRPGAQLRLQLREAGWSQDIQLGRELLLLDQGQQRPGEGAKADILRLGARADHEDIDAIARQVGQRQGIVQLAQLALDPAGMSQRAGVRVVQCLPGPAQDARMVAGDLEGEVVQSGLIRLMIPKARRPREQPRERLCTPVLQCALDALGDPGVRCEGVVEELLQIPAQVVAQVAVRALSMWSVSGAVRIAASPCLASRRRSTRN
jgi:hypothetical protein